MRVAYIPNLHATPAELGTVSSKNNTYVFVKFDKQVKKLGWGGTTSQACDPRTLYRTTD